MAITRTPIVDDDGSGTLGTVFENAWKQELYDQIDAALGTDTKLTSTVNTNQNNWAPGLVGNTTVLWSGNADIDITGVAGGVSGARFTFKNTGSNVAYFVHASASSSAGNRLTNLATSGKTPVAPGGAATWYYDGTNWKLLFHEQGAWITPTFSAGNFTGSGSMTWTVDSGDITTCRWKLRGKEILFHFSIATTTVGGTLGQSLQIGNGAWGGFTLVGETDCGCVVNDAAAGFVVGFVQASAGVSATLLQILKSGAGNWSTATNTTHARGQITFEVT